ncbi:hypothetical protein NDU88_000642 [Pleurodeles waltl]|uniref:Uncharacterized protein n=1 Tax=Pleurodeles waltl TaxID=8319 RepID=A0AAV7P1F4_PLEWA|nr:hypothetical protein NDU88_000642 [Pleurodeles waltl]
MTGRTYRPSHRSINDSVTFYHNASLNTLLSSSGPALWLNSSVSIGCTFVHAPVGLFWKPCVARQPTHAGFVRLLLSVLQPKLETQCTAKSSCGLEFQENRDVLQDYQRQAPNRGHIKHQSRTKHHFAISLYKSSSRPPKAKHQTGGYTNEGGDSGRTSKRNRGAGAGHPVQASLRENNPRVSSSYSASSALTSYIIRSDVREAGQRPQALTPPSVLRFLAFSA